MHDVMKRLWLLIHAGRRGAGGDWDNGRTAVTGTTEPQYVAPRYSGLITSGAITAGAASVALIWITAYAASPHRPAITAGITAIAAVIASVGATLLIVSVALRIVMGAINEIRHDQVVSSRATDEKLAAIKKGVDEHGGNVEDDHTKLHYENVDLDKKADRLLDQVAEVRALLADVRHKAQPETQQRHAPRQRRHRRREQPDEAGPAADVPNTPTAKVYQLGIAEGRRQRKREDDGKTPDS